MYGKYLVTLVKNNAITSFKVFSNFELEQAEELFTQYMCDIYQREQLHSSELMVPSDSEIIKSIRLGYYSGEDEGTNLTEMVKD